MNAGRKLLVISTLFTLAARQVAEGPLRFLLSALALLAWFQAVAVYKLVGIRLNHFTMMEMF